MADVTQNIDVRIQTAVDASNSAKTLTELKSSMRELNSLALESGDTQSAAYIKAATAAGQARDRIVDLRAQTSALGGSKLEGLSNSINLVGSSVSSLDFGAATSGLKGFTTTLKTFSFAELATEIKALAVAFGELAIAILSNPITWIAIAIVAVIAAAGKLGDVFDGIKEILSDIKDIWNDFTDSLGITHNELEKNAKAASDYADSLAFVAKNYMDVVKAQGQTGNIQNFDILNAQLLKANVNFEALVKKLNLSKEALQTFNVLISENAVLNKTMLERLKPGISDEEITAITEGYKTIQTALANAVTFISQLRLENEKLAREMATNLAEINLLSITNHKQAEIEKEKITYESLDRQNKAKEKALNEEYETLNKRRKTATGVELDELELSMENVLKQLGISYTQRVLAEKNFKANVKKINDKYDLQEKNNILKNLKTEYDLITSNYELTDEQKYNLHTQNLYKQEEATKVYYDKLIKNAAGNEKEIKQLETEKSQAVQALVDKNWAVYSEYYNKLNDAGLKEAKDKEDRDKKAVQDEKDKYNKFLEERIKYAQMLNDIDNLELSNMEAKRSKEYATEIDYITRIGLSKATLLEKQRLKEVEDAKGDAANIEAINEKYRLLNEQNEIATEDRIRKKKAERVQNAIELGQQAASALSAISDAVSAGEDEKVKKGEMTERDAKKRQFKRGQALGIASAVMNTAQGITSALAIQNYAGAAITGVIGAAQIAKILATKFDESSVGGGGGGGVSAVPSSPDFGTPPTTNTSTMFNPSAFYGVGTQRTEMSTGRKEAQRVYVVESDITSTQTRVQVQAQRATLSGV